MRHEVILWIANKDINNLARCCDILEPGKFFAAPLPIEFSTDKPVDEIYLRKWLNFQDGKDECVAVQYGKNIFARDDVKRLSDGKHFVMI